MAHGQITHIEVPGDDLERAKGFYAGLFGWEFQSMPEFPDYEMFRSGPDGVGGAIGLRGETSPVQPRIYVTVESLYESLARVEGLGGSIVVEKTEVPGMGWYAAVLDSEGSEIGLWEALPG
jgi:predicted enzyme related to lactoylglutathione lyase